MSLCWNDSAATAPANDDIDNAMQLAGPVGEISNLTTIGATQAPSDPFPLSGKTSGSIWFRYDAQQTTAGSFRISGAATGSRLGVYTRDGTNFLKVGSFTGVRATNQVVAGQTYYVIFQSTASTNALTLSWLFPTLFVTEPPRLTGLTAPATRLLTITNIEPDVPLTNANVWVSDEINASPVLIGSGTDFPLSLTWTNQFPSTNTLLWVEGVTADGQLRRSVTNLVKFLPSNDAWANAIDLDPRGGELLLRTIGSTSESGEPHSPGPGSIWYRWIPAASGTAQFDIGSSSTNQFSIYTGATLAELVELPLSGLTKTTVREAQVTAGVSYYIAVQNTTDAVQHLLYAIPTLDFVSPSPRTGLKAPGVIDLAAGPLPDNVQSVRFLRGGILLGEATAPPFTVHWTNGLTGNLVVGGIVELNDGSRLFTKAAILSAFPGNDMLTNAAPLPGDLVRLTQQSSAYLSSTTSPESYPGVWWKWVPDQAGYAIVTIAVSDDSAHFGVRSNDVWIAQPQLGSFPVEAGQTYNLFIGGWEGSVLAPEGFSWTIQNSPLQLDVPSAAIFTVQRPFSFTPIARRSIDHVAKVEYFEQDQLLLATTNAPFTIQLTKNTTAIYPIRMRVTLDDGTIFDGPQIQYAVRPINDAFADALEIPADKLHQTIMAAYQPFASWEAGDPIFGQTIWWKWAPKYSGVTTLSFDVPTGHPSALAGVVSVLDGKGDSITNLAPIASYNGVGPSIQNSFITEAGKTYFIDVNANYYGQNIGWRLDEETLFLNVTAQRSFTVPVQIAVTNYNSDEVYSGFSLLVNGQPAGALLPPQFSTNWIAPNAGQYTFAVQGTNNLGGVRVLTAIPVTLRPPNDNKADAQDLQLINGVYQASGNLAFSTHEDGEPSAAPGTVWYRFIPTNRGNLTLKFANPTIDITLRTHIWDPSKAVFIPTTFTPNTVVAPISPGNTYFIRLDTVNAADEPFSFSVVAPPPNDYLADAIDLTGTTTFSGTTEGASIEPNEFAVLPRNLGFSVWFKWTAPATGDALFRLDTGAANTAVIFGTNVETASLHALSSSGGISFRALQGETYGICFAGGAGSFTGHISLTPVNAPSNDYRRYPILLVGDHFSVSGTFSNATTEIQEPTTWGSSLWYRWVAPINGIARFKVDSGNISPPLILNEFTTGIIASSMEVAEGRTYEFALINPVGRVAQNFTWTLDVDPFRPTPGNDLFENRIPILTNDFRVSSTTFGTTGSYFEAPRTVWWELVPQTNGIAVLELSPREIGNIGLFLGSAGDSLTLLTWAPYLEYPLTNGVPLEISVGTPRSENFDLRVRSFYSPPANDRFTNSIHLEGTNITITGAQNFLTPADTAEPTPLTAGKHKGVWWTWYAAAKGRTTVTLNSRFSSAAAVYTGYSLAGLKKVTGSTAANVSHVLEFPAAADTIYHVLIDTMDGSLSFYDLSLSQTVLPPSANDNFDQPTLISGCDIVAHASTLGATREPIEPAIYTPNTRSVWFRWDKSLGGTNTISAAAFEGSTPAVAVYTGDSLETLALVARGIGHVSFLGDGAQTYRIAVETLTETDVTLSVSSALPWGFYSSSGNLVKNGSFEDSTTDLPYWNVRGIIGVHISEPGIPHGRESLVLSYDMISQDIATVPGKTYELRFICSNDWTDDRTNTANFELSWGSKTFAQTDIAKDRWSYVRFILKADSPTTRLRIAQGGHFMQIDAVSVVETDISAPPVFTSSLVRQSAYTGVDVTLSPVLRGTPPFDFQWYFGSSPIAGGTNKTLFLKNVALDQAGDYFLTVSNPYGKATGQVATVIVIVPDAPEILLQPSGDAAIEGSFYSMAAIAAGTPPLTYQWFKDGDAMANETNRNLAFSVLRLSDAGTYTLVVKNSAGAATSDPAMLLINPNPNEPLIVSVANFDVAGGTFAPVFDVDGKTVLVSTNYQVQLYAGASQDTLRRMGRSMPFRQGFAAGQFVDGAVPLTGLDGLSSFCYQFRAWDASFGRTYEEARASGGRFGFSAVVLDKLLGDASSLPLTESFSLRAGRQQFLVGKLSVVGISSDGLVIRLDGEVGLRYLIEKDEGSGWRPLQSALNSNGWVTFTNAISSSAGKFRSRIVD